MPYRYVSRHYSIFQIFRNMIYVLCLRNLRCISQLRWLRFIASLPNLYFHSLLSQKDLLQKFNATARNLCPYIFSFVNLMYGNVTLKEVVDRETTSFEHFIHRYGDFISLTFFFLFSPTEIGIS